MVLLLCRKNKIRTSKQLNTNKKKEYLNPQKNVTTTFNTLIIYYRHEYIDISPRIALFAYIM